MICFLAICLLFQLVDVLCIVDKEMNATIDGTEDRPKNESKYFSLENYFDSLEREGRIEGKQEDADAEELQSKLKDTSDIQNFLNKVETSTKMSSEASTIDIQDILNEVGFNKHQPLETVTKDSQSILNQDKINENRPVETAAKDIQRMKQNLIAYNKLKPANTIDIKSILNNFNDNFPAGAFDGQSILNDYKKNFPAGAFDGQSFLNDYKNNFPAETIDVQSILNSFNKNFSAVRMGNDGIIDYRNYQPAETAVLKIRTMDLDKDELNKYMLEDTGKFDFDKFLNDHEKDMSLVETITIPLHDDLLNEYENPMRAARRTGSLIGCIVTIICIPILIYLRCTSQKKGSKLRVFVSRAKPQKSEPSTGV